MQTKSIQTKRPIIKGLYGEYQITDEDEFDVKKYRISLLIFSISFCLSIFQWILIGPDLIWIELCSMVISIGFALKWIHIYIKLLHNLITLLWGLGLISLILLMIKYGPNNLVSNLVNNTYLLLLIGPLFAAITGIGFKEFFCFRRIEAIGLTLLVPITIIGSISHIVNEQISMFLLSGSAFCSLILSLRKFGVDPSLDIGDKSIFAYLEQNKDYI